MFGLKRQPAYETVHPEWWKENIASDYTPDLSFLERHEFVRIFVCDETQKRFFKHELLGEDKYRVDPVHAITHSKFSLVKYDLGECSKVIPLKVHLGNTPWARIRGELYGIRPRSFLELDKYKQNGLMFERFRINLLIPYRRLARDWWAKDRDLYEAALRQTPYEEMTIKAWMYVGKPDIWTDYLTLGWEDADALRHLRKTYVRNERGLFVPKIQRPFYKPVKTFTPNNKKLEEYYYYSTFHEFNHNGTSRSL